MTMLLTSWRNWRRAERKCFENVKKTALIRCIISWFGRISLTHVQRIVSLNTACPHEGHWWILEVLNSISSTLAMSWAAWVDSWLNSMLSFTGSSWRQNFLWTNFNSFNNLIIRVLTWKCTRSDVDIISVNLIHCGNRLLQVAWWLVHLKDVFRTVLNFR